MGDDMKVEHKPMPIWQKVFYFISFFFLTGAFIFLGTRDYEVREIPSNELFHRDYKSVSVENSFIVYNSYQALTFLEKGTGLLFLGFPSNPFSETVAKMLDEASKEVDQEPIYYFDFLDEREKAHDNYLGIVREVDEYLTKNDLGKVNLQAPTVVAVVKGDVIYFDDESSQVLKNETPGSYWTSEKRKAKILEYLEVLQKLKDLRDESF